MKLVVLGAPGAGKGTQSMILNSRLNIPHISTGDIFRYHIKNKTEIGLAIQKLMDEGQLISDDVTINILFDRLSKPDVQNGYILDGFPRTINQAVAAEEKLGSPTRVIAIIVTDELIIDRMQGRRMCNDCGATFHQVTNKPKTEDVCDFCGAGLKQRSDDMPDKVKERLRIYHESTKPIIDFYREKGLLFEVDGSLHIDKITEIITSELERLSSDGHNN